MTETAPEMEVPIGKHKYRVGRLSVFEQLHVAAEYRDIIMGLALVKRDRPEKMTQEEFVKTNLFIMASRGSNSPETRERIMNTCLGKVIREEGVGWQPIMATGGVFQFADISLPDMLLLVYAVLDFNRLIDFFFDGPSGLGNP